MNQLGTKREFPDAPESQIPRSVPDKNASDIGPEIYRGRCGRPRRHFAVARRLYSRWRGKPCLNSACQNGPAPPLICGNPVRFRSIRTRSGTLWVPVHSSHLHDRLGHDRLGRLRRPVLRWERCRGLRSGVLMDACGIHGFDVPVCAARVIFSFSTEIGLFKKPTAPPSEAASREPA